jgi:hypothetical protein
VKWGSKERAKWEIFKPEDIAQQASLSTTLLFFKIPVQSQEELDFIGASRKGTVYEIFAF